MSRPYSLEQLKLYLDGKLKEEISKNYKQLYEVSFSKEQNIFQQPNPFGSQKNHF